MPQQMINHILLILTTTTTYTQAVMWRRPRPLPAFYLPTTNRFHKGHLFRSNKRRLSAPSKERLTRTNEHKQNEKIPQTESDLQRKQDEYLSSMSTWKGASHTTSKHVTHFIASGNEEITVESAIQSVLPRSMYDEEYIDTNFRFDNGPCPTYSMNTVDTEIISRETITTNLEPQFRHDPSSIPLNRLLTPAELLALGAIWFLPSTAPRDPSKGKRPTRLQVQDLHKTLEKGDYLRVHHNPRRFPVGASYDWGKLIETKDDSLPGVIVARDEGKGYMVVCKPPGSLPVHATVDNILENVCAAVGRALVQTNETRIYIAAPQRLDHDTSGIFVVSTAERFSSYFARLLRQKTDARLGIDSNTKLKINDHGKQLRDGVQKKYRCLACLSHENLKGKLTQLQEMVEEKVILRHYLEDSIRAPKVFAKSPPETSNSTWLECLLRITKVGPWLINDDFDHALQQSLWGCQENVPKDCVGVVELEIDLLTGRTHQIRGQLASEGIPICGDTLYGGSREMSNVGSIPGFTRSVSLALQCCEIEFFDPDYYEISQGEIDSIRSTKLNHFRLEEAWWTTYCNRN